MFFLHEEKPSKAKGRIEESPSKNALYQGRDLDFSYKLGQRETCALRGVSLDIDRGEFVLIMGPSGSGKSTLLNLLGLIEPLQGGSLFFDGANLGQLIAREKNHIRRHRLGFIFQSFHLMPVLRADENIEYFLTRQGLSRQQRKERVRRALEAVDLWEHRAKKPGEMSGGQRQRVAIARAMAKEPAVIIADEPTASLDQGTGRDIMKLMRDLTDQNQVTIIMASHDPMVQSFATRELHLVDGVLKS